MEKYSYDYIKQYFEDNDCELLETDYVNSRTKMKYKCSCGEIAYIRFNEFQQGHRCNICGQKKSVKLRFLTIEEIRKTLYENGLILLTDVYSGNKQKLKFICHCGRVDEKRWNNLQYRMFCDECGKKQRSGENHYNWDSNKTQIDREQRRSAMENLEWRISVYNRDKSICQICGSKKKVQAHHLYAYANYPELRYDINNGICICKMHHDEFHNIYGRGKNTKEQFLEFCETKTFKVSGF